VMPSMIPSGTSASISFKLPESMNNFMTYLSVSLRGASPLRTPHTLSREPRRRLAPFAWLASPRSLASTFE
jgi:hypothetical protein